jgi:hypothetical protein
MLLELWVILEAARTMGTSETIKTRERPSDRVNSLKTAFAIRFAHETLLVSMLHMLEQLLRSKEGLVAKLLLNG